MSTSGTAADFGQQRQRLRRGREQRADPAADPRAGPLQRRCHMPPEPGGVIVILIQRQPCHRPLAAGVRRRVPPRRPALVRDGAVRQPSQAPGPPRPAGHGPMTAPPWDTPVMCPTGGHRCSVAIGPSRLSFACRRIHHDQLGDHPEQLQPPVEVQRGGSLGRCRPGQRVRAVNPDADQHAGRVSRSRRRCTTPPSGGFNKQGAFNRSAPLFNGSPKTAYLVKVPRRSGRGGRGCRSSTGPSGS